MTEFIKKPLGASLNELALGIAQQAINESGVALPCSVVAVVSSGIVTVKFEVDAAPYTLPQVTVPIEYPEYIRYPIKVGDKGMVFPADARLGSITGFGGGTPALGARPGNLAALSFVWLGSSTWTATDDPQAVVIYGPHGAVIRDTGAHCVMTVAPSGVTVSGVAGSLTTTGNLSAGNGASGTFTAATGQVITVQDGIITNIY